MARGISAEFLKEIEKTLREYWRISHNLKVVRRLNDREMMSVACPVHLWREQVHGLGFYHEGQKFGSYDPAFNLEIWTCRGKAGYRYHGPYQQVETTRQVWSRWVHVEYPSEGPGPLFGTQGQFELRNERDKALEEILRCARWVAEFWQNKGAVALLRMPELNLSLWSDEREHQRYVVVRVQDKHGNYADTIWCAPVTKVEDEDALLEQVLDAAVRRSFREWHEFDELGFTATCLGGGFLDIDYKGGKIIIHGQSEKYGKETTRLGTGGTRFLIKKVWYPDYDVEIKG